VLLVSVLFGAGSIALFALVPAVRVVRLDWPDALVLPWDALLSLAFFVQHSGMVRRPVRAWITAVIPARYDGAVYAIASGAVLALVAVLWQPSATAVLVLEGLPRTLAQACSWLAIAAFVVSASTLRRSFDPLGLAPIRAHLRGRPFQPPGFVVRGPYRWVRHPLYACIIALFWSNPDVTADRLLLAVLWTAWIWIATLLEERDLVAEFGEAYREYQSRVPMLIPWRGPVTVPVAHGGVR
jgi:hypothetical protein